MNGNNIFKGGEGKVQNVTIEIMSFGFKYGHPENADLVFDVRFLQNPYYVEELKPLTGLDEGVRNYIKSFDETNEFIKKLSDMLDLILPRYIKGDRTRVVIAFGCTGGKHRSVTMAEETFYYLQNNNYNITKYHRDIDKL